MTMEARQGKARQVKYVGGGWSGSSDHSLPIRKPRYVTQVTTTQSHSLQGEGPFLLDWHAYETRNLFHIRVLLLCGVVGMM